MGFTLSFDVPFELFDKLDRKATSCVRRHESKRRGNKYDDCYIRGDHLGPSQILFYVISLAALTPRLVSDFQKILEGYPHWEVVVIICPPDESDGWPEMGMRIREHEIIDDLQRRYFPPEFQNLYFEGARLETAGD